MIIFNLRSYNVITLFVFVMKFAGEIRTKEDTYLNVSPGMNLLFP